MEILIPLGVTAVGGTIGTVISGLILDYIAPKETVSYASNLSYAI